MSKISVEAFLDYLRRSQLTDEEKLNESLDEIKTNADADQISDIDFISGELVKKGLITSWHVRQLMKKKYKGFFLRQYRILGHIGSGGMSTVYLAEHTIMQRRVAIKVLPKKQHNNPMYLERFIREAQAIASLDHPNIVRAYDIDASEDIHYIVMEYFEGENLRHQVEKEGPLAFEDAVNDIRQAAEGLSHAHRLGIIHRDVKPDNLLVNDQGTVKVLDLGLALLKEAELDHNLSVADADKILGTADYLAPEQAIDSHHVDPRADIYSLGATLYFCLTGHPPFPQGSISQRLLAHQRQQPTSIFKDRPEAPQDLVEICNKMMEKRPDKRYQSAAEVARIMEYWLVMHGFSGLNDFPALSATLAEEKNKLKNETTESGTGTFHLGDITPSGQNRSSSSITGGQIGPSFSLKAELEASQNGLNLSGNPNESEDSSRFYLGQENVVSLFGSDTATGSSLRSPSKNGSKWSEMIKVGTDKNGNDVYISDAVLTSKDEKEIDPFEWALNSMEPIQSEAALPGKMGTETGKKAPETGQKMTQDSESSLVSELLKTSPQRKTSVSSTSSSSQLSAIKTPARQSSSTEKGSSAGQNTAPISGLMKNVQNGSLSAETLRPLNRSKLSSSGSNSGQSNPGQSNSGQRNSGQRNSGQSNSGQRNSGQSNSGQRNSGQKNSEQKNSRQRNSEQTSFGKTRSESAEQDSVSKQTENENRISTSISWWKQVPFWFWAVSVAGYVLATFLAGILFSLILNI